MVEGATLNSVVNLRDDGIQEDASNDVVEQTAADRETAAASGDLTADPDAQRKDKSNNDRKAAGSNTKARQDSSDVRLTKEEERAAFAFAEEHHPALATLVKKLRARDSDAYQSAIRELHLDSVRLVRMQDRQPVRFKTEISLWKVDSEIRLQLARFAVMGDERSEKNVRRLLAKRQSLRRKRLVGERERVTSRLTQINAQLNQSEDEQKRALDLEWSRLEKRIRPSARRQAGERKSDREATGKDTSASKKGAEAKADTKDRTEEARAAKSSSAQSKNKDKPKALDVG